VANPRALPGRACTPQLESAGGDARARAACLARRRRADDDGEPARLGRLASPTRCRSSTIHRAKGWIRVRVADRTARSRAGAERAGRAAAHGAGRWPGRPSTRSSPDWVEHEQAQALVEAAERARTLYVALTRARQRLVTSGCLARRAGPRGWETARSHAELLLGSAPAELLGSGRAELLAGAVREHEGARYRLAPRGGSATRAGRAPALMILVAARRDLERLPVLRAAAALESARPWSLPMRRKSGPRTSSSARRNSRPPLPRDVAALCGSLVHAALEARARGRPASSRPSWRARWAPSAPAVLRDAAPAQASAALAEAGELCRSFARGRSDGVGSSLAASIVARELPLLAPPGERTGAVGFLSGARTSSTASTGASRWSTSRPRARRSVGLLGAPAPGAALRPTRCAPAWSSPPAALRGLGTSPKSASCRAS
jgi:hypothetical protein